MRSPIARLALAAILLAARAATGDPLGDCLAAFPEKDPLQGVWTPEFMASRKGQREYRKEVVRKLALIRKAADAGHLPSQYLHITYFRGGEEIRPPIEGLLERDGAESWHITERLAEQGFALAQYEVGMRAKDAGFFPAMDRMGRSDEAAAAASRKVFFDWMTRSALQGNRPAWESLADFYALQIEKPESTSDDRIQDYAWTRLSSLPVDDWGLWENKKTEAWNRLRGSEEQNAATALAARYEKEVLPRSLKLRTDGPSGVCRLEPQFGK